MNDMAINGSFTVNEIPYRLLHLLGKGKGGYSYLALGFEKAQHYSFYRKEK